MYFFFNFISLLQVLFYFFIFIWLFLSEIVCTNTKNIKDVFLLPVERKRIPLPHYFTKNNARCYIISLTNTLYMSFSSIPYTIVVVYAHLYSASFPFLLRLTILLPFTFLSQIHAYHMSVSNKNIIHFF